MNTAAAVRRRVLMVMAPVSGQAERAVTAALAHWHRSQGQRVRVFKTGPVFLDPTVLACANGASRQPLVQRLSGDVHCAEFLCNADQEDLILIDAVMRLHDGLHLSAGLTLRFGLGLPAPLAVALIAIARDAAFSFPYLAIFDMLQALGVQLCLSSPLANEPVSTAAHALYVCSGYTELHFKALAVNTAMRAAVRAHHASGWPLPAERSGMLALLEMRSDKAGNSTSTLGLLPGQVAMSGWLVNLDLHSLVLPESQWRGPTFDYARLEKHLPSRCKRSPNASLRWLSCSKGCPRRSCTCSFRVARWPSLRCSSPEGPAKMNRTTPLINPCRLKKVNSRCKP